MCSGSSHSSLTEKVLFHTVPSNAILRGNGFFSFTTQPIRWRLKRIKSLPRTIGSHIMKLRPSTISLPLQNCRVIRISKELLVLMGKVNLLLVTSIAFLLRKTQLWSIHLATIGYGSIQRFLLCLIKSTQEWRLHYGPQEMHFALKMELDAHCKWGTQSEMLEGTAGNMCRTHFHFHLNTTEAALHLLQIKRHIKNAKCHIKF